MPDATVPCPACGTEYRRSPLAEHVYCPSCALTFRQDWSADEAGRRACSRCGARLERRCAAAAGMVACGGWRCPSAWCRFRRWIARVVGA